MIIRQLNEFGEIQKKHRGIQMNDLTQYELSVLLYILTEYRKTSNNMGDSVRGIQRKLTNLIKVEVHNG